MPRAAPSRATTSPESRRRSTPRRRSDLAVVVVGDQAGLFGRGTVGEGNDSESLELPGVQRRLVEAVVATGTPVVLVLLTGRPYAVDWALGADDAAPGAVLQAFFPGEGGGLAIADIITGAVNPSGRLPVSMPRSAGAQPYSYLHPILGGPSDVTAADSTPLLPFGFGLSYTSFEYSDFDVDPEARAGGSVRRLGDRDQHRRRARSGRRCRSTVTTSRARSPGRWHSCSDTPGSSSTPASPCA